MKLKPIHIHLHLKTDSITARLASGVTTVSVYIAIRTVIPMTCRVP